MSAQRRQRSVPLGTRERRSVRLFAVVLAGHSDAGLDISGTICFISGSVCGNGPSNGLSAEVNLSGYVDVGSASGGISVNGGSVTNSSFSLQHLAAHGHIT